MRYEQWLRLRLSLLSVYQGTPPAGKNRVDTGFLSAWRLHKGRAIVTAGDIELEVPAGSWVVIGAGLRWQDFTNDTELISLSFFAHWPDGSSLIQQGLPCKFPALAYPNLDTVAHELVHERERCLPGRGFYAFLEEVKLSNYLNLQRSFPDFIRQLLDALADQGVQLHDKHGLDPRVEAALEWIDRHDFSHKFSVEQLAAPCGLSAAHLTRLFREQLGSSPMARYHQVRLQRTRELLSEGRMSVKEIAYSVGFQSMAHFSRWFRQHAGITPSEWSSDLHRSTASLRDPSRK